MHVDLSTQSASVAGAQPQRSFAMIATDPTTVVDILAADQTNEAGTANGVVVTELTVQNPRVELTDSSTYVYYVLKQGAAPSAIWMDAPDGAASSGPSAEAWTVVGPMNGSYSAAPGELVLVNTANNGVTVTLPNAAGIAGQRVAVKDTGHAGTHGIGITSGGGAIDGGAGPSIVSNYGTYTFVSDGASWWIV